MAVGTNLKYGTRMRLLPLMLEYLGRKAVSRGGAASVIPGFCYKAGAPVSNTVADNPNAVGDICVDTTNQDVYICTAHTADASATTWVKITP